MTEFESSNKAKARLRLLIEWCILVIGGTVIFTIGRLAIFVANHQMEPGMNWNPWEDLPGMLALSAIGWAVLGLIGPLWLALGGLIGVLIKRTRQFHWLTAFATILFGTMWPKMYWSWMSV